MRLLVSLSVCMVLTLYCVNGRAIPRGKNDKGRGWNSIDQGEAMRQLVQYGYAGTPVTMSRKAASARFPDSSAFTKSLKDFQMTAGLPVTGRLDVRTKHKMASPRCADDDVAVLEAVKKFTAVAAADGDKGKSKVDRSVHYTTPFGKWNAAEAANLTWNVITDWYDLEDISEADTDAFLKKLLQKWQSAANICFFHNKGAPQYTSKIEIMFVPGNHDRKVRYYDNGFEGGVGGKLAHAFFPYQGGIMDGDVHLDKADRWRLNGKGPRPEFNLGWTALHEFGHTIGLGHSSRKSNVMYPWYPHNDDHEPQLSRDDIAGAQSLYGAPVPGACSKATMPKITTRTATSSDCSVDAAFETDNVGSYTIKGNTIKRYWGDYSALSERATLSEVLPAVDEDIIAAFDDSHIHNAENYVLLMSNSHVWIYKMTDSNTIASSFSLRPQKYTLSQAFRTTFKPSAAFMEKCRVNIRGVSRRRRCVFIIVDTTFYQYMYERRKMSDPAKLFTPVVNGSQVDAPSPMPLVTLNDYTKDRCFPTDYVITGVTAAAELNSDFIFFKGQDYIKMNEHRDDSEDSRGSISDILDCSQ